MSKKRKIKKAGVVPEQKHEHIWDIARTARSGRAMPVMRGENDEPYILFSPYDENPTWTGPLMCDCGQARWMVDGRSGLRRPDLSNVDATIAVLHYLAAKAERGEEFTKEERAWVEAFAEEFQKMLKPFLDALTGFAISASNAIMSVLMSDEWSWIRRLADQYSETKVVENEIKLSTLAQPRIGANPYDFWSLNPYPGMGLSPMNVRDGR